MNQARDRHKDTACIFCRIVAGEIATEIIASDTHVIAFRDVHPLAPVHILIIPRTHIRSLNDTDASDRELLGSMLATAVRIAAETGIAEKGYKVLIRTGAHGGQEVPHVHMHLIGGAPLAENIHPV